MTDPLGQSQVLPYLKGLSALGHQFHLISFEKNERYQEEYQKIEKSARKNSTWLGLQISIKNTHRL